MEEKKIIYTNSIGIEASIFDIRLKVNYLSNDGKVEGDKKELCEIAMSPQHAKAFVKVLENAVNEYEKNFGEITLNTKKEGK